MRTATRQSEPTAAGPSDLYPTVRPLPGPATTHPFWRRLPVSMTNGADPCRSVGTRPRADVNSLPRRLLGWAASRRISLAGRAASTPVL